MTTPISRRHLLQSISGVGLISLSGCSALGGHTPMFSVFATNNDTTPHRVTVDLIEINEEHGGRVAKTQEIRVPANDTVRQHEITESQPFLVRISLQASNRADTHYHFYPDCSGDNPCTDLIRIYINPTETDDYSVEVSQDRDDFPN